MPYRTEHMLLILCSLASIVFLELGSHIGGAFSSLGINWSCFNKDVFSPIAHAVRKHSENKVLLLYAELKYDGIRQMINQKLSLSLSLFRIASPTFNQSKYENSFSSDRILLSVFYFVQESLIPKTPSIRV